MSDRQRLVPPPGGPCAPGCSRASRVEATWQRDGCSQTVASILCFWPPRLAWDSFPKASELCEMFDSQEICIDKDTVCFSG